MLSNINAITESWMTHRNAAEIKELEIPRRYTEDSTASKTTNERAKATLDQVRSGWSLLRSGTPSMTNDSYRRERRRLSAASDDITPESTPCGGSVGAL